MGVELIPLTGAKFGLSIRSACAERLACEMRATLDRRAR